MSNLLKFSNNNNNNQPKNDGNNLDNQPNNNLNNNNNNNQPNLPQQQPPQQQPSKTAKNVKKNKTLYTWLIVLIAITGIILLITLLNNPYVVSANEFLGAVQNGNISAIKSINEYFYSSYTMIQITATGNLTSAGGTGTTTYTIYFGSPELAAGWLAQLTQVAGSPSSGVPSITLPGVISRPAPTPGFFAQVILVMIPWIIIMVIAWVLIIKLTQKQQHQNQNFKNAIQPQISSITFNDIAGYQEVKRELWELVDFLKQPQKYSQMGVRTPKGVLMVGPPGTGKTLFAKAVAGEAGIPFYSISGSDFVEMFVGVGASRVRSLFKNAKTKAPAVVFIDEIDAVGRQRGAGHGGGNDEREQTLNQLLVEMDGFAVNTGIIIMAATNRPDVLDPALKRPGRFDRQITLRLPDVKERESILSRHAWTKRVNKNINWFNIAMRTPGFSGAELENVVNEASILAIRTGNGEISLNDIDEAIDRVMAGPAKVNNTISVEEKNLIAHHEAGHAVIGLLLENAEKVQKISIVPRGDAGGYVLMTPKAEKMLRTKQELIAKIASYMGGRASEEIFFGKGEITTGAQDDIKRATDIARRMVTEFGMSSLGPIQYEHDTENPFLGRELSKHSSFSSKIGYEIDMAVKKFVEEGFETAKKIISEHKDLIELFSKALKIKETLNSEEIEYIFKHKDLTDEIKELEKMEKDSNKTSNAKTNKDQKTVINNNQTKISNQESIYTKVNNDNKEKEAKEIKENKNKKPEDNSSDKTQ